MNPLTPKTSRVKTSKDRERTHLSPAMRSWIDSCLVPILVREFLAEHEQKNRVEYEASNVAKSKPTMFQERPRVIH
jgi:hypothetical protein